MHFCKLEPLMRAALLSLCLVFVVGCKVKNPNFCEDKPQMLCDQTDGGGMACEDSGDCTGNEKVCNVPAGVCVGCLVNTDCATSAPICDTTAHTCGKCTMHSQCDSKACTPNGECAAETTVAYVDGAVGMDTNGCTLGSPCRSIMVASSKGKSIIKVAGMLDEAVSFGSSSSFTILAEKSARLTRGGGGTVLEVKDTANITVADLTISGGGIGIAMPTGTPQLKLDGVKVTATTQLAMQITTGKLTMARSNIIDNPGGGVQINGGVFVIVGNTFTNNGTDGATVGGLYITAAQNAMHRLEFNSFHRNKTIDAQGTGLHCAVNNFVARNNILYLNGTITNNMQVGGACTHAFSLVEPNPPVSNIGGDPKFKDGLMGDLHLLPGSPALGGADPAAAITDELAAKDIDGHTRMSPADIGADEVP